MSTRDTLIESTVSLWSEPHASGPSMRAILGKSGLTAPALYHHFDSLQTLYAKAQEQAFAEARDWFAARLQELGDGPSLPPHALPALMASLIDRWCNECRHLAFVRFECLLDAMRQTRPTPLATQWEALWNDSWQALATRCSLSSAGAGTAAVAAGLSLSHLIRVHPLADRCCVDEACRGWVDWALGHQARSSEWHQFALTTANAGDTPIARPAGKVAPLAEAAAHLLIEHGAGLVTHRNVAQQAGVSTGAVAHHCRTVSDLLRAAFATIYWQSLTRARAETDKPAPLSLQVLFEPPQPEWWPVIGWIELHLALARDPSLAAIAPHIRYRRGHMSERFLDLLLPSGLAPGQTDKVLFAHFIFGTRMQIAARSANRDFYRGNAEWLTATLSSVEPCT